MSAVLERLRTLRAETGAPPVARAEATLARALPAQYPETRAQLSRLLGLRNARIAIRPGAAKVAPARPCEPLPGYELAPGVRLVESYWAPASDEAPLPPGVGERASLRFLDTETTGLAGGTGTIPFVVALAQWQDRLLRVRQLVLTRPGAELAMLRELGEWLGPGDALVSYNGRCFDAPLLATRFRLHGLRDPLAGLAHRDLLHEVRRRHRRDWSDCRLVTAERQLLGVAREDDLPGSEAPAAWRSYLASGDALPLSRVLSHNRQDLVSLARLADRLDQASAPL